VDTVNWQAALKEHPAAARPTSSSIGESVTAETMDHAVAFAETGHLCLATLHANSANQALTASSTSSPRSGASSC